MPKKKTHVVHTTLWNARLFLWAVDYFQLWPCNKQLLHSDHLFKKNYRKIMIIGTCTFFLRHNMYKLDNINLHDMNIIKEVNGKWVSLAKRNRSTKLRNNLFYSMYNIAIYLIM
jgi:hypothetical protein